MKKRTSIEKMKQMYEKNKKLINFEILLLIGIGILCISISSIESLFLKAHKSQFDLCEKKARSIYSDIIQVMNENKQSEDFLVSCKNMPTITVKTVNYQGNVTAHYQHGKVVVSQDISVLESFFAIFVGIICEVAYVLLIVCICKKRKNKSAP